jgi:hypothetical protein
MKLPHSSEEVKALFFVVSIAAFAGVSRMLYGDEPLAKRRLFGSLATSMVAAIIIYGATIHSVGELGGYPSAAIGAVCGTFTDLVLKKIHSRILKET